MLSFLAACRARPQPFPVAHSRSFFSRPPFPAGLRVSFRPRTPRIPSPTSPLILLQSRHLSLGSVFSRPKPSPSPSPHVVVEISKLEAEADVNRHDVPKQLTLFQALVSTNLKQSYEVVISRWEKMCEFDPSSPLLHSSEAFRLYLTCLVNTGQSASVFPAVRRRDVLIAANTLVTPAPAAPADTANSSAASNSPGTAAPVSPPSPGLSESQIIGQSVLASTGQPGASDSFSHRLSTALDSRGGAHLDPIPVVIQQNKSWGSSLIRFVLSLAVGSFFFLVILSVFFENTGLMKAGPAKAQFEPTEGKTVKFSDVHGVDEAKEELQDVVEFLKDPTAFASLGGKLTKGLLLTGSPGTGKTMLARAVAGEAGVPFFFASGSDFEEMFVGVGAKRVRELFAAARKKDRAIIFIDELDAVGGKRSSRDQQYMKQTLNQLLVEMDGFQQTEGIIVIAATNFPQSLDQALVRPGRFDRIIAVPLPDIRGRAQILKHHMKGVITGKDVDTKILARGTPGFSGADLQNMVNQAAIQASKEHATEVSLKHFEWAKDRILMGAEGKSRYIDPKNKLATAYHEGGHALVALYTEGAMPLHKVTCIPRGHALGYTSQLPEGDRNSISLKEYLAQIDVSMGGRVAEELIYGPENVTSGASSDIQHATSTARAMVTNWGFSRLGPVFYDTRDGTLSSRRKDEIEEEVTNLILGGQGRATTILTSRIEELHRLAHALVEHETLDAEEVKKVIKGEPIRNITQVLEDELSRPNTD
ncbi:ATP-dependent peptidase [Mycena venus]|uniref:ATP-dependent peptidase n=1 Tax=Mycena venus TaxID=2733690 RepID=A0A8H6XD56_9AGAR|nr:ATP-dependent peptidase [Mycena venus]